MARFKCTLASIMDSNTRNCTPRSLQTWSGSSCCQTFIQTGVQESFPDIKEAGANPCGLEVIDRSNSPSELEDSQPFVVMLDPQWPFLVFFVLSLRFCLWHLPKNTREFHPCAMWPFGVECSIQPTLLLIFFSPGCAILAR